MAKKILVVDDEKVIRNMLKEILSSEGYEVEAADYPGDLLGSEKIYEYDLLILDFLMPGIPGDTLFHLLELEHEDEKAPPPVIIVSGYTDDKRVEKWGKLSGVKAVISKPFKPQELLEKIRQEIG